MLIIAFLIMSAYITRPVFGYFKPAEFARTRVAIFGDSRQRAGVETVKNRISRVEQQRHSLLAALITSLRRCTLRSSKR